MIDRLTNIVESGIKHHNRLTQEKENSHLVHIT